MADRTLTYTPPGEIDGSPEEVAAAAANQLARVLLTVGDLIENTVKQVENAGRQMALDSDAGPRRDREGGLDEWWRENRPQQAARAEALRVVAERLPGAARGLDYAVSRGE